MALTLKKAKNNLIRAQKEAARAYKKVEKARIVYNKLLNIKNKQMIHKKKRSASKKTKKSVSKKTASKKTKSKKTVKRSSKGKKRVTRGGGGSDWLSTVNSRGNVSGPDDHWGVSSAKWNSQFEKSGENIPMSELRKGGYELQSQPRIKIPTGFDSNAQTHEIIPSELGNLGTQRV